MQRMQNLFGFYSVLFIIMCGLALAQSPEIQIHNRDRATNLPYTSRTNINAGPSLGDILNYHYFPGILDYKNGNYIGAKKQMDYFLARPHFTKMNPRQAEFFSNGHYIRGMVYLYHASGIGRYVLAKKDFEQSILWDSKNHPAYLQLSRVFSKLDLKEQATSILQTLLSLNPEEYISQQALNELRMIQSGDKRLN